MDTTTANNLAKEYKKLFYSEYLVMRHNWKSSYVLTYNQVIYMMNDISKKLNNELSPKRLAKLQKKYSITFKTFDTI